MIPFYTKAKVILLWSNNYISNTMPKSAYRCTRFQKNQKSKKASAWEVLSRAEDFRYDGCGPFIWLLRKFEQSNLVPNMIQLTRLQVLVSTLVLPGVTLLRNWRLR